MNFRQELRQFLVPLKGLDKKVTVVFLSVAVLQTISWYFTSRQFFRDNFFIFFESSTNVHLLEYIYWFAGDFLTLFVIPLLIIKIIFKEKAADYGLTIGNYRSGLTLALIFLAIMFPVIWFASSAQSFASAYPMLNSIKESWSLFFIFEAGLLLYMFAWEFIWRGFMLFGLKEKFGAASIFIQMIPFVILHNGKPVMETFGAVIAAIALGVLAFRTGSIFYGVLTHFGVMFMMELFSILRFKSGNYGTGLNSFVEVINQLFNR